MRCVLFAGAIALMAACSQPAPAPEAPPEAAAETAVSIEGLPAGEYTFDPSHTSLTFRVNHLGFSNYTARFARVEGALQLDPAQPEQATLDVRIDPGALDLPSPPAGFLDDLRSENFFNVAAFPEMRYRATRIERTGANTARIHGDLTLRGVTKPVVLEARFNGGWAGIPQDPKARIGFSASGELNRSDFGMGYGLPPEGSTMGVSDQVTFQIETEMSGPAWVNPAATAPAAP